MPIIAASIVEVCIFKFQRDSPRYLLLHRSENEKTYPAIWQLVSGSVEGNETAVEAAQRELSEETGMSPKTFWVVPHVSTFYDQSNDSVNLCPMFAAQVEPGSEPKLSAEHDKYGWYSLEDAKRILVWPGQRQGLRIVHDYIVKGDSVVKLTKIR